MIRVQWLAQGDLHTGGAELIARWREQPHSQLWLDICDEDKAAEIALFEGFGCHELAIQDARRQRHPPKFEDFGDNTLVIYRGFEELTPDLHVKHVQIAFFIGTNWLISRRTGPSFGVQQLWQDPVSITRYLVSPALLFTRIVNASLSGYINHMVELEDNISEMEDRMLKCPTDSLMQRLVTYRSALRKLNRVFSYHERVFSEVMEDSPAMISMADSELSHAMHDVYDKSERLLSLGEMFYEQCGDLVEGYLSLSSHQLNQTMQVLTVITAIFVPLGFLAGLYGMNFQYMPELQFHYGYFYLLAVMATLVSLLLWYFRRRRWL